MLPFCHNDAFETIILFIPDGRGSPRAITVITYRVALRQLFTRTNVTI